MMSTRLSLSVALATYNGERYLGEQLDSIARQTRLPDELIISDDASVDATQAIVRSFAQRAPFPVRFQTNSERLGSTRNFETAIRACTGDIIFLCDQDDVWYRDKIALIEECFIDDPEVGAVFTDADVVDQDLRPFGSRLWKTIRFGPEEQAQIAAHDALSVLLRHPVVTGATMAFRADYRDLVLPMPDVWHDVWIALLIGATSYLAALPIPLIAYRQHSANQIGAPRRGKNRASGLPRRRKKRGKSFAVIYGPWVLCYELLQKRLLTFADRLPDARRQMSRLDEKLDFLRARIALPPARWRRLPGALRELAAQRYHRYAWGLKSFFADLWNRYS